MGRKNKVTIKKTVAGRTIKHGAFSKYIRQTYSDLRTTKGKAVREIIDGIIQDKGGADQLTAGDQILLSNVRSKIIFLLEISRYVDQLDDIITPDGDLPPVLGRHFNNFSESLRRDLQYLYASVPAKGSMRVPSIQEIISHDNEG